MRSTAPRALVTLCVLIWLGILTASCATTTASSGVTASEDSVRVACTLFDPIYWSDKDTTETVAQIKERNATGKALCGWGTAK